MQKKADPKRKNNRTQMENISNENLVDCPPLIPKKLIMVGSIPTTAHLNRWVESPPTGV